MVLGRGTLPFKAMETAILRAVAEGGRLVWRSFRQPRALFVANSLEEVLDVLAKVEAAAERESVCVGFVCYEAASAFDPALSCHPPKHGLPLAWFQVFEGFEDFDSPPDAFAPGGTAAGEWTPDTSESAYRASVCQLRDYIGEGETYQVNYSFRLHSNERFDPKRLFGAIASCRKTAFSAYLDCGDFVVCSASPEMFFELDGSRIRTRPMKGTAPRGLYSDDDARIASDLQACEKNRAENLMIVDMARNDLGRIARVGSVRATSLFQVERYATVHQMTSTVEAETNASLPDIFRALFPAASVTGAPKPRTMEIIRELETSPRGVYCGCIGTVGPGRSARFSVAIRTAVLDRREGRWEYGVGGGVVWDSTPVGEYEECRLKAAVLREDSEPFKLIETLRWSPGEGYVLLERHLARLAASAGYFDFPYSESAVRVALERESFGFSVGAMRVRLTLDSRGAICIESQPLLPNEERDARVALAFRPVDPGDRFLYHKTTRRAVYEAARAEAPNLDEVLLWNADGFLTEGTVSNVAVEFGGRLLTPPVSCGLLPGTLRAEMLERGELEEAEIRVEDLPKADAVFVLNSVRGARPAQVCFPTGVNRGAG